MTDQMPSREQLLARRLFADPDTFAGREAASEATEQSKQLDREEIGLAARLFGKRPEPTDPTDTAAALFGRETTDTEET